MVKKYKTRAAAMDALGQESLQESINGPLATFIGPKWMQWQGITCTVVVLCNWVSKQFSINFHSFSQQSIASSRCKTGR
jgi:hypothetical protein